MSQDLGVYLDSEDLNSGLPAGRFITLSDEAYLQLLLLGIIYQLSHLMPVYIFQYDIITILLYAYKSLKLGKICKFNFLKGPLPHQEVEEADFYIS